MTVEPISCLSFILHKEHYCFAPFFFQSLHYTFPQLSTLIEVVNSPVVPEILCCNHINVALNDIFVELLNRFLEKI